MTVTLPQINLFFQRIAEPSLNLDQIKQAKKELDTYKAKPQDVAMQRAIELARISLLTKEKELITAAKVNELYQNLQKFNNRLVSSPRLTVQEYKRATKFLENLKEQAQSIDDFAFTHPQLSKTRYIEIVEQFKTQLQSLNPNAWKVDWICRGIIVSSIATLFGYKMGWSGAGQALTGSALYLSLETGLTRLMRKLLSPPSTPSVQSAVVGQSP